jgi:hypothetical protein
MRLVMTSPLALAAAFVVACSLPAAAQPLPHPQQMPPPGGQMGPPGGQMQPPSGQRPGGPPTGQAPQVAPAKPYQAVAITPPKPFDDPSYADFRKQLGDAAKKRDRAALAKLVVQQGFFWDGETGDRADKKKSGFDNLAAAAGLNAKEGDGWDMLAGVAEDPTLEPSAEHKGAMCGPANPAFDVKAFEAVVKATGTDEGEWGFPTAPNLEVRGGPQANAQVIDKLGATLIRVMPDESQSAPPGGGPAPMMKIVTPAGKVGYVAADAIMPIGSDQVCYIKDASGWKITGYIGGDQ